MDKGRQITRVSNSRRFILVPVLQDVFCENDLDFRKQSQIYTIEGLSTLRNEGLIMNNTSAI